MLEARPSAPARWVFSLYLRRLFRKSFHRIRLTGHFQALQEQETYPVILYSNHQSWWDGLLEWRLVEFFGGDLRLMMAAQNLRQFPFFRRVGVFGVDLEDPRDRVRGLLHCVRLLKQENLRRTLVLFPQGELRPAHEPFLPFQGGLETLLRKSPQAKAFPVGKIIRPGRFQHPEVLLRIGEPLCAGASLTDLQQGLERCLVETLPPEDNTGWDLLPPHPRDLKRAGQ